MKQAVKYSLLSLVISLSILSAFPVLAIDSGDLKLQVNIGQSFSPIGDCGQYCAVSWIGEYVKAIYKYGISLAVILSIVMIMVGGFVWLLSAGSPDKVKTAKDFITSSLTGLVLALFSFVILQSINPNLVNLKPLQITVPQNLDVTSIDREETIADAIIENIEEESGIEGLEILNYEFHESETLAGGDALYSFEVENSPDLRRFIQENAELRTSIPLPFIPSWLEPSSSNAFYYYRGSVWTYETNGPDQPATWHVIGNPLVWRLEG